MDRETDVMVIHYAILYQWSSIFFTRDPFFFVKNFSRPVSAWSAAEKLIFGMFIFSIFKKEDLSQTIFKVYATQNWLTTHRLKTTAIDMLLLCVLL